MQRIPGHDAFPRMRWSSISGAATLEKESVMPGDVKWMNPEGAYYIHCRASKMMPDSPESQEGVSDHRYG